MDGARINDLVQEVNPLASDNVVIDGATTRRTSIQHLVAAGLPAQIGVSVASAAQGVLAETAVQPEMLEAAAEGYVLGTSWSDLSAKTGTRNGQPGRVPTVVTGTHTGYYVNSAGAVVSGTVNNAGEYEWSTSLTTWVRTGDVIDMSQALAIRANLTTEDLDTITTTGLYRQAADANATPERHYPDNRMGTLEVVSKDGFTTQVFTTWYGKRYWRTKNAAFAWQGWFEVSSAAALTAALANALVFRNNLTTEDLDTVTATGEYRQVLDADATTARHYPDGRAGILEVKTKDGLATQVYITWFGKQYWRTKYGSFAWQGWFEVAKPTDINRPYAGKVIAWIGDSIVEGGSHPTTVGANLGATVLKYGFASHTMAAYPSSPLGRDKNAMYRFATAIASGDWSDAIAGAEWVRDNLGDDNTAQVNAMAALNWATVDYLYIAFGTNDCWNTPPLGTALTADASGGTFMGALAYVIETIQAAHPHIQIMVQGMSWRTRYFSVTPEINSDNEPDAEGKFMIDYQDAILAGGEKYRIPAFDMYRKSGINPATYSHYLSDGVHPNATTGQALWTKKCSAFLLSA